MRQQAARNSNDQESISRRSRACRRPVTCTAVSCRKCPYLSFLPVKLISTAARSSTGNPAANPAVQTVTKSAIYTKLSAPALVLHGICALAASERVTFNFHSHVVAVDPLQLQLLLGQPRAAQRKRRVPVTWRPGRYAKHIVCVILVARRFTQTLFEHAYRQMQTAQQGMQRAMGGAHTRQGSLLHTWATYCTRSARRQYNGLLAACFPWLAATPSQACYTLCWRNHCME